MTESEAINRLRDHFRIHDDGRPTPYLDDAVSIAIKALEKQIPKKPIKSDGEIRYCEVWKCPKCGFEWSGMVVDYCYKCGQSIDFSGVNE